MGLTKLFMVIDIIMGMNVIGQLRKVRPTMKEEGSEECAISIQPMNNKCETLEADSRQRDIENKRFAYSLMVPEERTSHAEE